MNIEIVSVKQKDKGLLWNLLQFALYDGSFYIDNKINNNGFFEYDWFNNYFTDDDRYAYFIKSNKDVFVFKSNKNI